MKNYGQGVTVTYNKPAACHHCAVSGNLPNECGTPDVLAVWVDADGYTDGAPVWVCHQCFRAGSPAGPGYRSAYDVVTS